MFDAISLPFRANSIPVAVMRERVARKRARPVTRARLTTDENTGGKGGPLHWRKIVEKNSKSQAAQQFNVEFIQRRVLLRNSFLRTLK